MGNVFNFMLWSSMVQKKNVYLLSLGQPFVSLYHITLPIILPAVFSFIFGTFSCLLIPWLHSVINTQFSSNIHLFCGSGSDFLQACLFKWKFCCFPVHLVSYYSLFKSHFRFRCQKTFCDISSLLCYFQCSLCFPETQLLKWNCWNTSFSTGCLLCYITGWIFIQWYNTSNSTVPER